MTRTQGGPQLAALLAAAVATASLASSARALTAPDSAILPGQLEGHPLPSQASPLQALVDAAHPGDTLEIPTGEYRGDLVIDQRLTLIGRGRPRLVGSGAGSVVRVRAAGVTLAGFDIDGQRGGDLGRDSSGIHVAAAGTTIRDCRISEALFGIYLRQAHGASIEGCVIQGIPGRAPGERGSGIHVWDTRGFRCLRNNLRDVRDGIYIQSSSQGLLQSNSVRDVRYGLHYMFSDDNTFEDNLFENGDAGTALMYSRRIVFRRNRFLHNRGFASVGLLFKTCDDVLAESNLIADNARGIFLEGSARNVFRGNIVAQSDVALMLYDSVTENRFEGNSFVGNLTPLTLVGRRTDTLFRGNYFSDNGEPDLDGDGRSDRPYRLSSVFDHLRGNLLAADLFAQGLAAATLGAAERSFPVLDPVPVVDAAPLAHAPLLPDVPRAEPRGGRASARALGLAALVLAAGAAVVARGYRGPA